MIITLFIAFLVTKYHEVEISPFTTHTMVYYMHHTKQYRSHVLELVFIFFVFSKLRSIIRFIINYKKGEEKQFLNVRHRHTYFNLVILFCYHGYLFIYLGGEVGW